jgi:YcxB-like protein
MTENDERFTFEFEIGQAEQVRAARVMLFRQRSTKVLYAFLFLCLLIFVVAEILARFAGRERWPWGIPLLLLVASIAAIVGYYSPIETIKNIRKSNRAAAGPHVFTLTDGGVEAVSPGARGTIEWPNFAEIYESKESFLLYFSKGQAVLLPKRAVPDVPSLRRAFRRWVGERARLRDA